MNPIATGITAALISGVAMYTAGAKSAQADALTPYSALVQTVDGQFVPATATALRPAAGLPGAGIVPISDRTTGNSHNNAPRRRANRAATVPAREVREVRQVPRDEDYRNGDYKEERSWGKTAMIVGGSAAGGAGVGGIVGGTKGALIGAAIGGGAASIYEATQRR